MEQAPALVESENSHPARRDTCRPSPGLVMAGGLALTLGLVAAREVARADNDVPFPQGYREWKHVKSALVGPQSPFFETAGGLHHVYANEEAMKGLRSGSFPDGAVLVFELLATVEKAGVTSEGSRQRVDVMLKDRRLYRESGGWGFERYVGDNERESVLTAARKAECFACHQQGREHDFVFSRLR